MKGLQGVVLHRDSHGGEVGVFTQCTEASSMQTRPEGAICDSDSQRNKTRHHVKIFGFLRIYSASTPGSCTNISINLFVALSTRSLNIVSFISAHALAI